MSVARARRTVPLPLVLLYVPVRPRPSPRPARIPPQMTRNAATPASVLREVDAQSRLLARRLVREARHAALAAVEPETGAPLASRVAVGTDMLGDPVLLVSRLSAHTKALLNDGRVSLLFGEPGRGNPLAHPRLMLRGEAASVEPTEPAHATLRRRFLERQPKARLYVDFPDFLFLRVAASSALLNAGFGQAYPLERADLCDEPVAGLAEAEPRVVAHMNEDHGDALDAILAQAGESGSGWRLIGVDATGFEAALADRIRRVEFSEPVCEAGGFRTAFVTLARQAGA